MVLKDWKEAKININHVQYYKDYKPIIDIQKAFTGYRVMIGKHKWKTFKTKSQALKYAKSYMKKY